MYIFVTGGKTMGHISPLLSIILSMKDKYEFVYFGLKNSMEEEVCIKNNIRFEPMLLTHFYRKNIFKNLKTFYLILKERKRIQKSYKKYNVKAIISSGGFVSVPLVLSNFKCKKILLESNTSLGLANRFLGLFVDHIVLQFDTLKNKKIVVLGNPITIFKPTFDHLWFYQKEPIVLFVGGSNGAFEIVKMAYEFNQKYPNIKCFVITGNNYYDTFVFNDNVKKYKRISNLSSILNKFHLIISRAGASTITELLLSNSVFILAPSKNVSANHQVLNARYIKKCGACEVIEDIENTSYLDTIYCLIQSENKRLILKLNSEKIIQKNSLEKVIQLIEK